MALHILPNDFVACWYVNMMIIIFGIKMSRNLHGLDRTILTNFILNLVKCILLGDMTLQPGSLRGVIDKMKMKLGTTATNNILLFLMVVESVGFLYNLYPHKKDSIERKKQAMMFLTVILHYGFTQCNKMIIIC